MSGYQTPAGKGGGYAPLGSSSNGNPSLWQRIPSRWKWLPLDLASGIPLLIGVAFFNECQALPELTLMLVLMGGIGTTNAFAKFGFELPHNFDKQEHLTWQQLASNIMTFLQFGMACALAGETYGQTYRLKDGGEMCEKQPYQCGFLASVINIFFLLGIYGYYTCRFGYRRVRSEPAAGGGGSYMTVGSSSIAYETV